MLPIYIVTHNRPYKQVTFDNLPPTIQNRVTFVIQEGAPLPVWRFGAPQEVMRLPPWVKTISETRNFLAGFNYRPHIVMDDDVVFAKRRTDDPTKFTRMNDQDYEDMLYSLEAMVHIYPLVGISAREGANRNTEDFMYATRQMRVHAYNPIWFVENSIKWNLLQSGLMEDFSVILQILTKGAMNCVVNSYCQNQGGSDVAGGCSDYRTPDLQAQACEELKERFPEFVTVVEKETKTSWGGGVRKDVRIQWKKALEYGRRKQA